MRSFSPSRLLRALSRRTAQALSTVENSPAPNARPLPEPTVYADAPLRRLLMAIDRRASDRPASDLEHALAEYARARRAAGVQPEAVLIEFKRVARRAIGMDPARPPLTGRLIELYFAS
jgi:hypothetical protein